MMGKATQTATQHRSKQPQGGQGQKNNQQTGLQGLQAIKQLYQQGAAARERQQALALAQAAQTRQRDADRDLFARSVGAVKPLPQSHTAAVPLQPARKPLADGRGLPADGGQGSGGLGEQKIGQKTGQKTGDPKAGRQEAGGREAGSQDDLQNGISDGLSDQFDPFMGLDLAENGPNFCRPGVAVSLAQKLKQGHWPEQAQLDLHGLRSDEARLALGAFIERAHALGLRCVRVVHGKGMGSALPGAVLQTKARSWLVQIDVVLAFVQASAASGGAGAVVVLLRAD